MPGVDIVIPIHNARELVDQCLQSVEVSRRRGVDRVILVDDGSGPQTSGLLAQFAHNHADVELIPHDQAKGFTKAANAGLRSSRGDVVVVTAVSVVASLALASTVTCAPLMVRAQLNRTDRSNRTVRTSDLNSTVAAALVAVPVVVVLKVAIC